MLNVEVNRSAEGVERYFDRELAVSDYFMKEPGIWAGRGAERLGLRGPVERSQFVYRKCPRAVLDRPRAKGNNLGSRRIMER
jgi:hypothetical protein